MKKLFISILLSSLFVFSISAQSYHVNLTKSNVVWIGEKLTGSHKGNIKIKEGELTFDEKELEKGVVVIDMLSLSNTDVENVEMREKLEKHLKAPDFFDVEKYQEATLEIIEAVKNTNKYNITGRLTIKGITGTIKFVVNLTEETKNQLSLETRMVIDRTKYNIQYNSGSFFDNLGDKMIYDDFVLEIKLVVNKK